MPTFATTAITVGAILALTGLPMSGGWWHVVRWAFYLPVVFVGGRFGSFAGLLAGVAASLTCAFAAVSWGFGDASWPGILAPDFIIVGLLGGFMKVLPRFRLPHSAGIADARRSPGPTSESELGFDLNPLTSIESAAELLAENDTPVAVRQELIDIIRTECEHLSGGIIGLLQRTRGAAPPRVCEADITPIINGAVREAAFLLSGRGIVVRGEIAPDLPPIQCNPDQIRNLIVSLTMNAAQRALAGNAVVLKARSENDGVTLEVRNQGQGSFVGQLVNKIFGGLGKDCPIRDGSVTFVYTATVFISEQCTDGGPPLSKRFPRFPMPVGRYRITDPINAMFMEDGRHVAREVPEGTVIAFDPNALNGKRIVHVTWDEKKVMMFAQDLRAHAAAID